MSCPTCNTPRERCRNRRLQDLECCRAHQPRGILGIHNYAAGKIGADTLNEVLEHDGRNLDGEFTLSRVIVANIVASNAPDGEKLKAIEQLTKIAKNIKECESGGALEIKFDDKMAEAIRRRFKTMTKAMEESLLRNLPGDSNEAVRKQIMEDVRHGMQLQARYTPVVSEPFRGRPGLAAPPGPTTGI